MKAMLLAVHMLLVAPATVAAETDARPCSELGQWEDGACNTPREGGLSGFYLALDAGYTSLDQAARRRVGLGGGRPVMARLGFAFWDHLALEFGAGRLGFKDYQPTSEKVVDCTRYGSADPVCGTKVRQQTSEVSAAMMSLQLGVQHRFRPTTKFSIVPGAMLGYLLSLKGVKREVTCDGCPGGRELDFQIDGVSVEPFLRFTFSALGWVGAIVRSRWFLTGDLIQQTTLGVELGLP